MAVKDKIQVYITGGTFDKTYNYITGELYFRDTHLPEMFQRGRSTVDMDIKTLMMIDSLEMTDADREIIAFNCDHCPYRKVLITHGTDRMVQTAKMLAGMQLDKTIVLTGAMIPYAFGDSSDGFFNLGAAVAFVQALPPGVYISMNGRFFDWNNVKKNRKTGYFEEIKE